MKIIDYMDFMPKDSSASWEELRKLSEELRRISEEFDVTILMPTHDNLTITGRATGPNLQNIPIRTELGARIREAYTKSMPRLELPDNILELERKLAEEWEDDQ